MVSSCPLNSSGQGMRVVYKDEARDWLACVCGVGAVDWKKARLGRVGAAGRCVGRASLSAGNRGTQRQLQLCEAISLGPVLVS